MVTGPNIALVNVDGDIDVVSACPLRARLDALLDDGCRRIILDVTHVGFLDSAGVATILSAARRIRSLRGLLSLTNASHAVYRSLAVACLVDYIPTSLASQPAGGAQPRASSGQESTPR